MSFTCSYSKWFVSTWVWRLFYRLHIRSLPLNVWSCCIFSGATLRFTFMMLPNTNGTELSECLERLPLIAYLVKQLLILLLRASFTLCAGRVLKNPLVSMKTCPLLLFLAGIKEVIPRPHVFFVAHHYLHTSSSSVTRSLWILDE